MLKYTESRLIGSFVLPVLILFFLVLGLLQVKDHVTLTGIETSRISVIQSVVDQGTFDISHSLFETVDKAELNGKKYGDKPPLLTFMGIVFYGVLRNVFSLTFEHHSRTVLYLLSLTSLLFAAGCGLLVFSMIRQELPYAPKGYCLFASLMCVVSTLVFSYSVTFANHVPTAFFLLLSLKHYQNCEKKGTLSSSAALIGGILAGTIFNCEFILGGCAGIGFFLLTLLWDGTPDQRLQRTLSYSAGAVLMLLLEMGMNYLSYGSVLPLYLLTHRPDMSGKNYLLYAFHTLFGFEGFYLYSPALLFLFAAKFCRKSLVRIMMIGTCFSSMLLFWIVTSDYGGWSYGFRFFVPIAPVFLYYIFVFWRTWRKGGLFLLFLLTLLWGCVFAYVGTFNPWNASFEGQLTRKGTICEKVRNSFLANLLAESAGNDLDSVLTRFLVHRIYGPDLAWRYLAIEFWNRGDLVRYTEVKKRIRQ